MDGAVVALTVVAAYDISQDDRRARVAALLQSWGDRIQKSVYVLRMPDDELIELQERAGSMIDPDTDGLVFLRQCKDCWQSRVEIGQMAVETPELAWIVM